MAIMVLMKKILLLLSLLLATNAWTAEINLFCKNLKSNEIIPVTIFPEEKKINKGLYLVYDKEFKIEDNFYSATFGIDSVLDDGIDMYWRSDLTINRVLLTMKIYEHPGKTTSGETLYFQCRYSGQI